MKPSAVKQHDFPGSTSSIRKFATLTGKTAMAWMLGGLLACPIGSPRTSQAAVLTDVSAFERSGMEQLYALSIPDAFNWGNPASVPYTVDNSSVIPDFSFSRVAYYFEVQRNASNPQGAGPREWVYAEFDIINDDQRTAQLGVPVAGTGKIENGTLVTRMNVESNVPGITEGRGLSGIIEFWSSNYGPNGGGLYGSNNSNFDWKDTGGSSGGGHGSMQIFNITTPGAEETLFGFNGLNQSGRMGIGTEPGGGNTDWTFGPRANTFSIKNLEVWVGGVGAGVHVPEPQTGAFLLLGLGMIQFMRRSVETARREKAVKRLAAMD